MFSCLLSVDDVDIAQPENNNNNSEIPIHRNSLEFIFMSSSFSFCILYTNNLLPAAPVLGESVIFFQIFLAIKKTGVNRSSLAFISSVVRPYSLAAPAFFLPHFFRAIAKMMPQTIMSSPTPITKPVIRENPRHALRFI